MLYTGLPLTPKRNTAVAVFVDKMTKYVYAAPCNEKSNAVDWASMYVEHVVQHEGLSAVRSVTGALSSTVRSTRPWLSAWVLLGTCLLHVTLSD